jgi:nucleoside-diphosphate-sugar epimerase
MSQLCYALLPGSWVLVSGANGFIASHIVDILLERGYNVRGTVRTEKPWLNQFFETKYGEGRFETVIVSAIEYNSAFDEAAKGVSGFIHVVSDP